MAVPIDSHVVPTRTVDVMLIGVSWFRARRIAVNVAKLPEHLTEVATALAANIAKLPELLKR